MLTFTFSMRAPLHISRICPSHTSHQCSLIFLPISLMWVAENSSSKNHRGNATLIHIIYISCTSHHISIYIYIYLGVYITCLVYKECYLVADGWCEENLVYASKSKGQLTNNSPSELNVRWIWRNQRKYPLAGNVSAAQYDISFHEGSLSTRFTQHTYLYISIYI